jgi:hypothetical protein
MIDYINEKKVKGGKRRMVVKEHVGTLKTDHQKRKMFGEGKMTKTVYKNGELKKRKTIDYKSDDGVMSGTQTKFKVRDNSTKEVVRDYATGKVISKLIKGL